MSVRPCGSTQVRLVNTGDGSGRGVKGEKRWVEKEKQNGIPWSWDIKQIASDGGFCFLSFLAVSMVLVDQKSGFWCLEKEE